MSPSDSEIRRLGGVSERDGTYRARVLAESCDGDGSGWRGDVVRYDDPFLRADGPRVNSVLSSHRLLTSTFQSATAS